MPEMAVRDQSLSVSLYRCRKRTGVEGKSGTGVEVIILLRAGSVGVQVESGISPEHPVVVIWSEVIRRR
jgi:hypothetical protein